MPTRRTATLLTITQPDQSGGIRDTSIGFTRFSAGLGQEQLTVSHSVLDQEKGAAGGNCVADLLCSSPAEPGQNTTTGGLPSSFLEVTLPRAAIVISCGPGPVELVGARPSFLRRRIGGG
jgi:hypothetical protein